MIALTKLFQHNESAWSATPILPPIAGAGDGHRRRSFLIPKGLVGSPSAEQMIKDSYNSPIQKILDRNIRSGFMDNT